MKDAVCPNCRAEVDRLKAKVKSHRQPSTAPMTDLTWNTYSLPKGKAQCPVCAKWVRLLKHDRLWPHGPANNLCRGSWISRVRLNDGSGEGG